MENIILSILYSNENPKGREEIKGLNKSVGKRNEKVRK
jgi:hypothetical protein